jgi:cellulose synthase/poly-beta-1,6-N-acetylglucosamine synthase-like glycosyltransferase
LRQPRRRARRVAPVAETVSPYAFLVGDLIDVETLQQASRVARRWRAWPHEVLVALGRISREQYAVALARHIGVGLVAVNGHARGASIPAGAYPPDEVARIVVTEAKAGRTVQLTIDQGAEGRLGATPTAEAALQEAVQGLARRRPEMSAAKRAVLWQVIAFTVFVGLLIGGFAVIPSEMPGALLALITIPFVLVTVLRLLALWPLLVRRRAGRYERTAAPLPDDALLPVYTVMVPLYQERGVIPDLIAALSALDWPAGKLDILLVLEEGDAGTRARVAAAELPAGTRVIVVPAGKPRTKPRALNYALPFARGDIVVVYDAEDVPVPDQLRRAYAVLRAHPETIGCVQARLNIHNAHASWLAAHFTMEYAALFDGLLPMLERLDLPMPLGGTSNHFPRRLLEGLGAWDPYNVTEDADLGLRLCRSGWRVAVLASTTWEEAPVGYVNWRNQRTRWLKGWMQTMLVHTRRPVRLVSELGEARFLGLLAFLGGLVLSAIVHPWLYLVIAYEFWRGGLFEMPTTMIGQSLWGLAAFNLLVGYAVAMLLAVLAALRRGRWLLTAYVVLLPLYWLAISYAAYRALWQLVRNPFLWEKTRHSGRGRRDRQTRP